MVANISTPGAGANLQHLTHMKLPVERRLELGRQHSRQGDKGDRDTTEQRQLGHNTPKVQRRQAKILFVKHNPVQLFSMVELPEVLVTLIQTTRLRAY